MLLTFHGPDSTFFHEEYFNFGPGDAVFEKITSTEIVMTLKNPAFSTVTRGTGLDLDPGTDRVAGTIESHTTVHNGEIVAEQTGLDRDAVDYMEMMYAYEDRGDFRPMGELYSQSPITIDAASAAGGLVMDDWARFASHISETITATGSGFDDALRGGMADDLLMGRAGDDEIDALSGDDVVWAGTGHDIVHGFDGHDAVGGGAGDDRLVGGLGDDSLYGGGGDDLLNGESGADILWAFTGDDTVSGGSGDDAMGGGAGRD